MKLQKRYLRTYKDKDYFKYMQALKQVTSEENIKNN